MNMPLRLLLDNCGSDKNTDHSYGPFYDTLAARLLVRERPLQLMEIGVQNGSSIKAFSNYFQNRAVIYGVDLNVDNITTMAANVFGFVADQTSSESLLALRDRFQAMGIALDLIIDDASHAVEDQLRTCEILWPLLAPDGYYVIEDIQHPESIERFRRFPGFQFIDLRNTKNRCDDMLVVLHNPPQ